FVKPSGGVVPTTNTITNEGRLEIVAPLGFEIDSIVSHSGTWVHDTYVNGPQENLTKSYLGFTLVSDNPQIIYEEDEETLLFTIYKNGDCPGSLNIIDEETDPVALACIPTQANLCIFNKLNVLDQGTTPHSEYFYIDNYSLGAWSCQDNDGDGILNAYEDVNGDGFFNPGTGETDLNDPCDPFHPVSAALSYEGETVTCVGDFIQNAHLQVEVEGPVSSGYTVQYSDGNEIFIVNNYQVGDEIPVSAAGDATYILINVSDANGCSVETANLEGEFQITGEGPINFTVHPTDITSCAGSFVSMYAEAENNGAGTMQYQWEISCDAGTTWVPVNDGGGTAFLGSTTSQLTISVLSPSISGCQFRLGAKTGSCDPVYSEAANVSTEGPLAISQSPADVLLCGDDQACFSVEVLNGGDGQIAYQWQAQQPNSNDWNNLTDNTFVSGASTSQICFNEATNWKFSVRAVVKPLPVN
ncbi:MAG: hypothetical protein R2788_26095, partial [Saprospiraceae bacterium]